MSDLIPFLNAGFPLDICRYVRRVRRRLFQHDRTATFEPKYRVVRYVKKVVTPNCGNYGSGPFMIRWKHHNIYFENQARRDIVSDHFVYIRAILNNDQVVRMRYLGFQIVKNIDNLIPAAF